MLDFGWYFYGVLMEAQQLTAPDIETASEQYARRFSGPLGEFLLGVQSEILESFLEGYEGEPLKVLDVGGGHGQVAPLLIDKGFDVWIHGSCESCNARLYSALEKNSSKAHFFSAPLSALPFEDDSFDLVVGIRLIGHVEDWNEFISELARVSRRAVIIDYPPSCSFNFFYPLFFQFKKLIEGDTRPFVRFSEKSIREAFQKNGFRQIKQRKQFFLPMGIHRLLQMPKLSYVTENTFATIGLTKIFGSPAIVLAESIEMLL